MATTPLSKPMADKKSTILQALRKSGCGRRWNFFLRWEFLKENKNVRKKELDQERDQEKKKVFFLFSLVVFLFSWSLSWSSSFFLPCFLFFLIAFLAEFFFSFINSHLWPEVNVNLNWTEVIRWDCPSNPGAQNLENRPDSPEKSKNTNTVFLVVVQKFALPLHRYNLKQINNF